MRDVIIGALLFLVAAAWGTSHFRAFVRSGQHPFFYQSYYEPAVMLTCGRGFQVTAPGHQPPALRAFLLEQADSFSCDQLPADLAVGTEGLYQRPWRYLMTMVALAWKVLGISWSRLAPMFGALFAITIVLTYALCRLVVGRVASLLCAGVIAVSPLQLANLPNLRDYAKAPFSIALVLMLIALAVRRWRTRDVLALSLAYGLVLGIGYGFRTDLLIDIPPFVVTVLLFVPDGAARHLGAKAAAIGLCAAGFVVAGWPIITSAVQYGGCQWHMFLLGLTSPFNSALGVRGGSYGWGHLYNDEYVWANVSSYARQLRPDVGFIEYCSHDYDVASWAYAREILARFPADFVTRAYAAAMHVVNLPFDRIRIHVPVLGTAAAAAFACVVSASSARLALFAVFVIGYFAGYPAIQFLPRHYFPFEFIGWLVLAFLVERGIAIVRTHELAAIPFRRAAVFAAVVLFALAAPLWLLRSIQGRRVAELLESYAAAPVQPFDMTHAAPGRYRVAPPPPLPTTTVDALATLGREHVRFLEVTIDPAGCRAGTEVTFVYDHAHPEIDFSYAVAVETTGAGATRVLEPIYDTFLGVDVSDQSPACAPRFALSPAGGREPLLPAQLTADWASRSQYQRIQFTR